MQQRSVEQGRLGGEMRVMSSHRHGVDELVTEPADVQNYEGLAIAWEVSKNTVNLKSNIDLSWQDLIGLESSLLKYQIGILSETNILVWMLSVI